MNVAITGRRPEALEETATAIRDVGGVAQIHRCDLADDSAVMGVAKAVSEWADHGLAVLVHCAARYAISTFEESSLEEFDAVFRANVRAPFMLTQLLLPA